jgi:tripartite-type tricarboxylate transporter receptor subunit TctC
MTLTPAFTASSTSQTQPRRRVLAGALATLAGGLGLTVSARPGQAQSAWAPSRPVTLVVPYPPGGPTDILARTIASDIAKDLGQPVNVENVPGGAGAIGTRRVAQAPADGYTLALGNNQTHATNVSLLPQGGGYDPVKDFSPIMVCAALQHIVVVGPNVPVNSVADLLALARRDPGRLTAGSTGPGSASHLALELFKTRSGTDIAHVAYKGSAPLLQDLLGGHVNLSFATTPTVLAQVQAGKLKALAVASPQRSPHLPELPTLAQAAVTGVEADAWLGFFAPAGVPAAVLTRYRQLIGAAMQKDSVRATITKAGMAVDIKDAPEFAAFLQQDIQRWAEVVRSAKVRID